MSGEPGWAHFPHGADVGVRGCGPSIEAAFAQAARALTAIVADPESVEASQPVHIACSAPDPELLLAEWLNALIFEMATRAMLFGRFDLSIDGDRLEATAWGEPLDRTRHDPGTEAKGATYTALRVAREAGGCWVAECVVDV